VIQAELEKKREGTHTEFRFGSLVKNIYLEVWAEN
jgi:hypothetical protein